MECHREHDHISIHTTHQWKIINPYNSMNYKLTLQDDEYPYFTTESYLSYFAIITKIPYTRSVNGNLIDPLPIETIISIITKHHQHIVMIYWEQA